MAQCEHVLVYARSIGGYTILCRKCGEIRGGSESADPRFLAGLNRNQRRANAAGKRPAASRKSRSRYGPGRPLPMKRDVDLSRAILLYVEEHAPPQGTGLEKPLEIEGYDRPTVLAHAELLIEDGLLDGRVHKSGQGLLDVHVFKLTARGHDAIAAARDNTAWKKAKRYAAEHSIPLTIGALVEVIKAEIRKHIPLP